MEAGYALDIHREDLVAISGELAEIYQHICIGSGEAPSAALLNRVEATLKAVNITDSKSPKDAYVDKHGNGMDYVSTNDRLLDTIRDQLRHLKELVDIITVDDLPNDHHTRNRDVSSIVEGDYKKTLNLESLLSIRDEQIATLRAVLMANKQTAEVELANLKSKYEKERFIVRETMMQLRNELNGLKECKTTFVSLRSLFALRCDQFINQLNDLQTLLVASEEEIRQLYLLLNQLDSPKTASLTVAEEMLDGNE